VNESISAFGDAVAAFGDRMGDTHPLPLAIALAIHTLSLMVRARIWRTILRSAFPGRPLGVAAAFWAYVAGVGANALAPMRGGDVVRIYAVRRLLPGASVATIVATLLAESLFGLVVVVALAVWAVSSGGLPPLVKLPDAKAFEFSFYAQHPVLVTVAAVALIAVGLLVLRLAERRVRALSQHIADGFRVVRPPGRFARNVALPQLVDWLLRAATAYALLDAFGIHASLRAAVLVLVVDSVATAIPFTPGGAGAQQALLAFALGATASQSQILAFSIGNQAVITLANIALGIVALLRVFGHLDLGRLRREAAT
jgi:glycosyltransferase 2 family protein